MANDAAFAIAQPPTLGLDNSYARLPERFYARLPPSPVAAPRLLKLNRTLAQELGLDPELLASPEGVEMLAGNRLAADSQPVALAYAGHQFGNFVPQLGDGRAILLGEVVDRAGRRRDLQLKGSGRTPFSRGGDGRAALGPVLREYLVSEAMFALGIPTTRTLAAVATGESVFRETALPGAVLTRVAASHIRVGTFQYFAARRDVEALRLLADYVIDRHYPEVERNERRHIALLERVIARQAELVARWLLVGFIHGVMNTDNTSIAGETIDYGPCAFMDAYDPATVFSSIDHGGRYAYANQPRIAGWNLARFAETLLPLISDDSDAAIKQAQEALEAFNDRFSAAIVGGLRAKLGLATAREDDAALAQRLLDLMQENRADFTFTFRHLGEPGVLGDAFADWEKQWHRRLAEEGADPETRRAAMQAVNPAYIPRNQRVEAALAAAVEQDDYAPFEELLMVLSKPYETRLEFADYEQPAPPQPGYRTFCGT
jgi:serine/tyrosine/threonine adenylyltransferase